MAGVGEDPADTGGGEEDELRMLAAEEGLHGRLVEEVELRAGARDDVRVSLALQLADDRRPDEAAVPGDENAALAVHTLSRGALTRPRRTDILRGHDAHPSARPGRPRR